MNNNIFDLVKDNNIDVFVNHTIIDLKKFSKNQIFHKMHVYVFVNGDIKNMLVFN